MSFPMTVVYLANKLIKTTIVVISRQRVNCNIFCGMGPWFAFHGFFAGVIDNFIHLVQSVIDPRAGRKSASCLPHTT